MNIINYTTGGLGNRLRPLSSAYAISKTTGRELYQYWDKETTNGCLADFNDLFENNIKSISKEQLLELQSYKIYSDYAAISRLSTKYGLRTLKTMVDKNISSLIEREKYNDSDTNDNIILYCNNFIPNTNINYCYDFIRSLKPIELIQNKIDIECSNLNLNKNIVGIHARGTDFGVAIKFYIDKIHDYINHNNNAIFFLSTDDDVFEKTICNTFGDKIITRKNRLHITKTDANKEWDYNFIISKEKSQDSIIDLFLLSKTNIQIYHQGSTFCQIANIISKS